MNIGYKQDYIPVRCILPACWPYLPVCAAAGGGSALREDLLPGGNSLPGGAWSGGWYPTMQWGRSPCEQNS